jgi:hypothetical protein
MTNTLTTIETKQKKLVEQTLDIFAQELKGFFEKHPDLESVEILNPDSYNDEGYFWPSHGEHASMTVVVNNKGSYWDLQGETPEGLLAAEIEWFVQREELQKVFRLFNFGSITAERFGDRIDMAIEESYY